MNLVVGHIATRSLTLTVEHVKMFAGNSPSNFHVRTARPCWWASRALRDDSLVGKPDP
ncbi:MAG TPA: hypothetical protein VIX58_01210 [Anaerolineae bacterium]